MRLGWYNHPAGRRCETKYEAMLKPQKMTFRSHFGGVFGGSAVHPAGIPQHALHSHPKSPSIPRQRSRTAVTPVQEEEFGPAPSTSSTPAPLTALPRHFGHICLHGHHLLPAAKVQLSPQRSPRRAEEREAPRPRGPPSRLPSGGSSERLRSVPSRFGPRGWHLESRDSIPEAGRSRLALPLGAARRPRGQRRGARAAAKGPPRRPSPRPPRAPGLRGWGSCLPSTPLSPARTPPGSAQTNAPGAPPRPSKESRT